MKVLFIIVFVNNPALADSMSSFGFVLDGISFNVSWQDSFRRGRFKRCSILLGTTDQESVSDIAPFATNGTINYTNFNNSLGHLRAFFPAFAKQTSVAFVNQVVKMYLKADELNSQLMNYFRVFERILTDSVFRGPTLHLAEYYARNDQNVFLYLYSYCLSLKREHS